MNKEEYYNRIEKINNKFLTDRVSADEEYQLVCQRNYLSTKYIKHLEQQCKKQKEVIDDCKEDISNLLDVINKRGVKMAKEDGIYAMRFASQQMLIDKLKQENKQLKERIEYLERSNNRREDTILEQRQEISDLEDNWNKLKKAAKNHSDIKKKCYNGGLWFEIDDLLNKMIELEQGSDNNE